MTQKITADNIDDEALDKLGYDANRPSFPPKLYSIHYTNSSFANSSPSWLNAISGGYLKVLGDNFESPMVVFVGQNYFQENLFAALVTVVSPQELNVRFTSGFEPNYYTLYVVKADGTFASKHEGLRFFIPI
jgi:hypothetical protein